MGAGQECEDPSPKEEGVAEITHDELTSTFSPCPPVPLREETEKSRVKLSLGRRKGFF